MEQVADYEKEIKTIQQEISNDPYNLDLISRKQELINTQRELIKSAEQEKESIKALVSDGYNKWLDALQKSIDLRKKELDSVSDLYEYEKKIQELSKNVSTYEKQMISLQFDSSEEAKAKRQKISVELQNAKDDLAESEYDRWKSDSEKMLDKFVENLWKLFDFDHQNCAFKIKEIRNEIYQQEPIIKYEPYKYSDYIIHINPPQI